jgi:hypothetical protein
MTLQDDCIVPRINSAVTALSCGCHCAVVMTVCRTTASGQGPTAIVRRLSFCCPHDSAGLLHQAELPRRKLSQIPAADPAEPLGNGRCRKQGRTAR